MHILHETPIGYAIFSTSPLGLHRLISYSSAKEAVEASEQAALGEVPDSVLAALQEEGILDLGVGSQKLAGGIKKKLQESGSAGRVCSTEEVEAHAREIHSRLPELLNIPACSLEKSALLLAHALAQSKLQMTAASTDIVLVQSIGVLDRLDKDINAKCMRIKEWYGLYFPELCEIVPDNRKYLEAALRLLAPEEEGKENAESEPEPEEEEEKHQETRIGEALERTIGGEVDPEDRDLLKDNAVSVLHMFDTRERLQEHLYKRMKEIAPNLLELVGEHIGAKLVAHAGSLSELARKPASTIQIMGAEKALFKAIKEKGRTPKYGYVYNTKYVSQAPIAAKGQIARTLSAKLALACRCDMYGESRDGAFGIEAREKIEKQLKHLSEAKSRQPSPKQAPDARQKFTFKRPFSSGHKDSGTPAQKKFRRP